MRKNIRFIVLLGAPLVVAVLIAIVAVASGWFPGSGGDGSGASRVQQTDGVSSPDGQAAISGDVNGGAPPSVQQQVPAGTLDETFVAVADTAPGFGGLFFDDAGAPTIYVQDPAQAAAAEAAVRATFGSDVGDAPINVRVGQYDFGQLKTWHESMLSLFSNSAVVFTDVDESQNRLTVGLEDLGPEAEVRADLDKLGIPQQAVNIERAVAPVLEDQTPVPGANLIDKVRPLAGGLKIALAPLAGAAPPARCTLGFIARLGVGGKLGFVTASHCTIQMFDLDAKPAMGGPVNQPKGDAVGRENLDPKLKACPPKKGGTNCRASDSAFIELNAGIKANVGKIKRPATDNSTTQTITNKPGKGATAFVAGDFVIVATSDYSLMDQPINKVGQRTGWTRGKVTRTCFDVPVPADTPPGSGTPTPVGFQKTASNLLCQMQANYFSASGDSGSPVFQILMTDAQLQAAGSNVQIPVRLKGIHWAGPIGNPKGDGRRFSPLGGIMSDLPGLTDITFSGSKPDATITPSATFMTPKLTYTPTPTQTPTPTRTPPAVGGISLDPPAGGSASGADSYAAAAAIATAVVLGGGMWYVRRRRVQ